MDSEEIGVISCEILCLVLCAFICLHNYLWELSQVRQSHSRHYLFSVSSHLIASAQWNLYKYFYGEPKADMTTTSRVICTILRFAIEYFNSLSSVWIVAGLVHFCLILWNHTHTEPLFKRFRIGAYILMCPYSIIYACNLYETGNCWDGNAFKLYTSLRPMISNTIVCPVLLVVAVVKFYTRPVLATRGGKVSYKKGLIIFPITMLAYIAIIVTHFLWLFTDLLSNRLHEAIYTLLLTATHVVWIIFYSWDYGLLNIVKERLARYRQRQQIERDCCNPSEGFGKTGGGGSGDGRDCCVK